MMIRFGTSDSIINVNSISSYIAHRTRFVLFSSVKSVPFPKFRLPEIAILRLNGTPAFPVAMVGVVPDV